MNKEIFKSKMQELLLNSSEAAINTWEMWAEECVDVGQYVNLKPTEKNEAVSQWLDSLYAGFYFVKKDFGEETALQVCELGESISCLYPGEMKLAAKHLSQGGDPNDIVTMINDGSLEDESRFFPNIEDLIRDIDRENIMKNQSQPGGSSDGVYTFLEPNEEH